MTKTKTPSRSAGGHARAAKLSARRRSGISSKAARTRWSTPPHDVPEKPATRRKPAVHPQQPVVIAAGGILRFKENRIISYMLAWAAGHNWHVGYPRLSDTAPDLNEIARLALAEGKFSKAELRQLNQLAGFSVSGCPNLSDAEFQAAQRAGERLLRRRKNRR